MACPRFINNLGFSNPFGSTSPKVNVLFDSSGQRKASNGMTIIRVTQDSPKSILDETLEVLGRGECGSARTAPDPLLDWVYAGVSENTCGPLKAPPSAERLAWFRWMAHYCGYFALARGGLYCLHDGNKIVSAAATGPPKTVSFGRMSGGEMGDNIREAGMIIGQDILANNMRMRALGAWQDGIQASAGLSCTTNYLYLVMYATLPEAQGKGCGKALLQFLGEVADADGVAAFLETAGARNCGFYKTGGFEVVERSVCGGFTHEGGGVGMKRMPVARGRGEDAQVHEASKEASSGCSFAPKRPTGPLSQYCRHCNKHQSMH